MAGHAPSPPAECYLQFAHELQGKCHRLGHINGAPKLERKIIAEVKFLRNLLKRSSQVQESHLKSSNLSHYAAIVHAAENLPGTVEILRPFSCPGKNESLIVDVVAGQGLIWVKVIARKAQALHLVWAGQGQFGERDLLRQSEDYLESASQHHYIYTAPDMYFVFYNNVTSPMATTLRDKGVKVLGHEVPVDVNVEHKLMNLHLEEEEEEETEDTEDAGGGEDDLETDAVIASASEFVAGSKSVFAGDCPSYSIKEHDENSRTQSRETDNFAIFPQRGEVMPEEISLSSEVSLQKGSKSGTSQPYSVYRQQCSEALSHVTTICPSQNTDPDGDHDQFTSSASCLSNICDKEHICSSEPEHHNLPSKRDTSSSKGLSHSGSEDTECSLKSAQVLSLDPTRNTTVKDYPRHVGESVTSSSSHQYTSQTPSSANYHRLMTELLGVVPDIANSIVDHSSDIINSICKLNLDITTLITLVSAVTHGHCNFEFTEKILTMQAEEERKCPVLPELVQFMKGKELYACKSAVEDFSTILATLGGDGEKQRARELLARVTIIDDNPSQKALQLKNLGKIKDRSKTIFGTGDSLEAITMTANSGFLRAAKGQGVSFAVFVHAARALTEDKERTATPI